MKKTIYIIAFSFLLLLFTNKLKAQCSPSFTMFKYGLTVNFTSKSSGTSPSTRYNWSFGDGTNGISANPVHVYSASGKYYVQLLLTDTAGAGCYDSVGYFISVTQCMLQSSFVDSISGLTVNFTSTSSGTTSSTQYDWSFGDGSGSKAQHPRHTYSTPGNYFVSLVLYDTVGGNNCLDTIFKSITVGGCSLVASFTERIIGQMVSFTSTSSGTSSSTQYEWDFGDGSGSSVRQPTHTYSISGNYLVSLIISDTTGGYQCRDTINKNLIVGSCSLVTSFSESISGKTVSFTSTSTGVNSRSLYNWNFGDGNISTSENPTHTYVSPGVYPVTLIVYDTIGGFNCIDTTLRYITIGSLNVFTPNGDGLDDVFILPCSGTPANVFNSKGLAVKSLPLGAVSWDGTNRLGGNEPTGLYYVYCTGSSIIHTVTLVR